MNATAAPSRILRLVDNHKEIDRLLVDAESIADFYLK